MSNTPNEDANPRQESATNYGNPPQQSGYGFPQQGPYGTPPNYPPPAYQGAPQGPQGPQGPYDTPPNYPPPGYSGVPQGPQGQFGSTPNYSPPGYPGMPQGQQGQYGVPPNYPPQYAGPQQGPYGYGANPGYDPNMQLGYGYNNPNMQSPASSPLPLGEAIRQLPRQYLRVVTKPGVATFAMEQGKAAWNIVWVQILILTLFTVVLGFASIAVTTALLSTSQGSTALSIDAIKGYLYFLPFGYILLTPLGLFISLGIYHLIAKMFGGTGTFLAYMYSYLLYGVPLTLLTILLVLIPFVGSIIASAISIYMIVLQIFMTMAVHRLRGGRATFAVLLLPIIGFVLAIVGGIIIFTLIMSAFQHAYPR